MTRAMAVSVALLACALPAATRAASPVAVNDAWAKPAGGGAAIYATIVNGGEVPDRLIGATTPNAAAIELHDAAHGATPVAAIAIPADGTVTLAPGGASLSVVGLKGDLQSGDAFLTRLHFERAGWIVTIVRVRTGGSTPAITSPGSSAPAPVPADSGAPVIPVPRIAH